MSKYVTKNKTKKTMQYNLVGLVWDLKLAIPPLNALMLSFFCGHSHRAKDIFWKSSDGTGSPWRTIGVCF